MNLFTRLRRFGKTLNMSMLKSFFEIGTDKTLFDGLAISKEADLCEKYMGRFPVVFISLKGVDGLTFELATERFRSLIQKEAERLHSSLHDEKLTPFEREMFSRIEKRDLYDEELPDSLKFLSKVLYRHYGQKAILLIDEYDVPLDKAFAHGYYDEMVSLLLGLLYFAVLTGCLRVSKESIFTGLNNFDVNSILDAAYDEQFGFTQDEVNRLLADYGLNAYAPILKEWYVGNRFGNADVYCPWDVINYAKKELLSRLCAGPAERLRGLAGALEPGDGKRPERYPGRAQRPEMRVHCRAQEREKGGGAGGRLSGGPCADRGEGLCGGAAAQPGRTRLALRHRLCG